jgi:hypothetical protein
MKSPRIGRPRAKLPKPKAEVTVRMRRLLDYAHDGNVHEASQVSGIAYATLRDLYTGRSTNPNMRTLQTLAKAYGMYTGWFTDPNQPPNVPPGGYVLQVPGFAYGPTPHIERDAMIPFLAHPLASVYARIDDALEKMPSNPMRPIVGETNNEKHWRLAMGEFLLAPLLSAERQFRVLLIPDSATWSRDRWEDPDVLWPYVRRLKRLGLFWESVVEHFLGSAPELGQPRPATESTQRR